MTSLYERLASEDPADLHQKMLHNPVYEQVFKGRDNLSDVFHRIPREARELQEIETEYLEEIIGPSGLRRPRWQKGLLVAAVGTGLAYCAESMVREPQTFLIAAPFLFLLGYLYEPGRIRPGERVEQMQRYIRALRCSLK